MRFYWPIAKIDAEQRMVWGYASTEMPDDQGETVTREALTAALDGYMRFANIREMHQNSAVGVAKQAEIDDRGLYLAAKIVDDDAWRKVTEGVYNGFSIGGRVTARDPANRRVITGLVLTEISVVDRPANPEAVFDCWKLAAGAAPDNAEGQLDPKQAVAALGRLGRMLADLEWLGDRIKREGTQAVDPPSLQRVQAIIAELCGLVAVLAAREGRDRQGGTADPDAAGVSAPLATVLGKARRTDGAPAPDAVAKLAEQLLPRLDALQRRVEEIAAMPLPPQTAGRGVAFRSISKREDAGSAAMPPGDIAAALAGMSDEERTLVLIKAAHARPISPFAAATAPGRRDDR